MNEGSPRKFISTVPRLGIADRKILATTNPWLEDCGAEFRLSVTIETIKGS